MPTDFVKLNHGWNAEPNAPALSVAAAGRDLLVRFRPNPFQFPDYQGISMVTLTFHSCARYRVGKVNDEAWHAGECRFSGIAPGWGEFYEVSGDLKLEGVDDWVVLSPSEQDTKHFLFYFRDEEFECDAAGWSKEDAA